MSNFFKGITFPWQEVTPSDDAIVRRATLPDRCLSGCDLSYSGHTLTMAAGTMIVCGRQFRHTAAQNWSIVDASSGYARLLLTIDVTKASTEAAFDQISTSIEYAAAVDGFPELRQDDINGAGTIYQTVLCVIALGVGGITGIVTQMIPSDNIFFPGRPMSMGGNKISELGYPSADNDAASKKYVDNTKTPTVSIRGSSDDTLLSILQRNWGALPWTLCGTISINDNGRGVACLYTKASNDNGAVLLLSYAVSGKGIVVYKLSGGAWTEYTF